jgi:hypothetical protein
MKNKIDDGQMDFFGLLSEYTDDQGATVRVREPKRSIVSREPDGDYVQLTIDFGKKAEPEKAESIKTEPIKEVPRKNESKKVELAKEEPKKVESEKVEPVREDPKKIEPEKPEPVKEEPGKLESKKFEFAKPEPEEVKKVKPKEEVTEKPQLFKDCSRCWCHDCKHNLYNEAVPRELAGRIIPCPACKTCEEEGSASLCEIGNAKEGCRLRALEEGIIIPETEEI